MIGLLGGEHTVAVAPVRALAAHADRIIVVGAPNSSNSKRLVEVAERAGCARAMLVQRASDIPWEAFAGAATLGITAGASAGCVLAFLAARAAK